MMCHFQYYTPSDWKNSNHGFNTSASLFSVQEVPVAASVEAQEEQEECHINDISTLKGQLHVKVEHQTKLGWFI